MTAAATLGLRVAALALAVGCAPSIEPRHDHDASTGGDDIVPTGAVTTVQGGDGTSRTLVDATLLDGWTHVDFETGAAMAADGPWDLRFQRFHVSTNGGASGSGGVAVAAVAAEFAAVAAAPGSGFIADADVDGDQAVDYAFDQGEGWYDYNPTTHVLSPKQLVWIVKTAGGSTIKLAIESYYDRAGTAGWMTVRWAPL